MMSAWVEWVRERERMSPYECCYECELKARSRALFELVRPLNAHYFVIFACLFVFSWLGPLGAYSISQNIHTTPLREKQQEEEKSDELKLTTDWIRCRCMSYCFCCRSPAASDRHTFESLFFCSSSVLSRYQTFQPFSPIFFLSRTIVR